MSGDPRIFTETGIKLIAGDIDDAEAERRLIGAGWTPQAARAHVDRWRRTASPPPRQSAGGGGR